MIHKKLFLCFFSTERFTLYHLFTTNDLLKLWNTVLLIVRMRYFYRVFLQLCPSCFVISTDLDRYLSRGLKAQSATISMRYSALRVEMVLQHSWHESTNPSMVKDDVMWHRLFMRLLILWMLQWADGSFTNLT